VFNLTQWLKQMCKCEVTGLPISSHDSGFMFELNTTVQNMSPWLKEESMYVP
jgi:hypothetical protein